MSDLDSGVSDGAGLGFVSINVACGEYNICTMVVVKDLTCTFRASCYSARLSWALVLTWVSHFIKDKKK